MLGVNITMMISSPTGSWCGAQAEATQHFGFVSSRVEQQMTGQSDDSSLARSSLWRLLTVYGSLVLAVILVIFLLAVKLRLLAKFGYYLGGLGLCFLLLGAALLFNTGLLVLGNVLILAGL